MNKIKSGRYMVAGRIAKVDVPTEGKWKGYTFITEIDRAGNEIAKIKDWATRTRLIEYIAADPKGCLIAYGRRTGVCGCCGRTLTNPSSVEAGIGPICAQGF